MWNRLIACFLFTLTMVPSFALPFSVRMNVNHGNTLSASVSTGIVIALVVLFIIPLLWCAYRMGTRTRRNPTPTPVYTVPLRIFPITPNHSNIPSSGQMISPPHPVHKKVCNPTSR